MARVLVACPGQKLAGPGRISLGGGREKTVAAAPAAPRATAPAPRDASSSSGRTDPQFRTCGDAIDAGYGPYRQSSDPEYDWYQDRDDDGLVCER
jgi:hypothetical protein